MLNAIAREVGHAANAVTDAAGAAVEAVLPGKGSKDDAPTEDEDVHRKGSDQQQGKQQDKESKRDQAKVKYLIMIKDETNQLGDLSMPIGLACCAVQGGRRSVVVGGGSYY
jgi:hypothetical protein